MVTQSLHSRSAKQSHPKQFLQYLCLVRGIKDSYHELYTMDDNRAESLSHVFTCDDTRSVKEF